jgi:hypothetical protein
MTPGRGGSRRDGDGCIALEVLSDRRHTSYIPDLTVGLKLVAIRDSLWLLLRGESEKILILR